MSEPIVHIDYGQCYRVHPGTLSETDDPDIQKLFTEPFIDCSRYPQARCMTRRITKDDIVMNPDGTVSFKYSGGNEYGPDAIDNPMIVRVFDEGKLVKEIPVVWKKFSMTITKHAP